MSNFAYVARKSTEAELQKSTTSIELDSGQNRVIDQITEVRRIVDDLAFFFIFYPSRFGKLDSDILAGIRWAAGLPVDGVSTILFPA